MASLREQMKIRKLGLNHQFLGELYYWVLRMSWAQFVGLFLGLYLIINCLFAGLYMIDPLGIDHIRAHSFFDAFVFSNQTFSTVGYGYFLPRSDWAHSIVILECMSGILFSAIMTGLTFAKFSRPTTQVVFSRNILVAQFDGTPMLMFRMGNGRDTSIVDARVTAVTLKQQTTQENISMQRFVDLKLEREQSPFFLLTWTVMHRLDKDSPFYGYSEEDFRTNKVNIFASLIGYDETFSETVHAGWRYSAEHIHFGHKFVDVITTNEAGERTLDFNKFDDIIS